MTATLVRIESDNYETSDLEAVAAQLAHLQDSPLAAQLQAMIGQLREGEDLTLLRDEEMLTTTQAAGLLRISRPMVTALIRRGEIAALQVGAHHRVPAREVLEYIERRDETARQIASSFAHDGLTAGNIAVRRTGVDPETAARLGY